MKQKQIPALDGVRAVAVLMVMLFHFTWLSCGWAGVQIFFVLSGYLITRNLLADRSLSVGDYLKRFYWRRSLRIFPIYYGYLLLVAVLYLWTKSPYALRHQWPYLVTYTVNFSRIFPSAADVLYYPYFGHFWSLAVEEQFYWVWPLFLYLLPTRMLNKGLITIVLASPVVRWLTAIGFSSLTQDQVVLSQGILTLPFCQLDAFAAGALLVGFEDRLRAHSRSIFVVFSVVALALGQWVSFAEHHRLEFNTTFGFDRNMFAHGQYVWGYTVINLWTASLVLFVSQSTNLLSGLLQSKPARYIGRISYGMYVYHLILLYAARWWIGQIRGIYNIMFLAGFVVATIAVSAVSYALYERRFLAMKDRYFSRTAPVEVM